MTTTTISELDAYRAAFAQEGGITRKFLGAYPEAKVDLRPSLETNTPREIAWTIVITMLVVPRILAGRLVPEAVPEAPRAWPELLAAFDRTFEATKAQLAALDDAAMNGTVATLVGPNTMGEVRRADALRMFLHDQVHHRGQLSVHLRMAGGPVPSIYGPSKDEPWY